MARKILTKRQIEDLIYEKDPTLFGRKLAERHLKMVQDAVRDWGKDIRKKKKKKKSKKK